MKTTGIVVRTWNDAPITRRDSDGYADATAMCQANGKRWFDYERIDRTTDYITALADATGLGADQLVISTTTGPNHLRGTWIHPRLAVDLARWISPQFAVWMDGWFLDSINGIQRVELSPLVGKSCVHCGKQMHCSPSRRYCSNACKQAAWRCRTTPALNPVAVLNPGIHVVANSPRQANWIWALAVEQHVSSALMTQIAAGNRRRRSGPNYQLHLLPPAD
jgi:hypothetical protein